MKKIYRILCISSLGVLLSSVVAQASVVLMGVAMAVLGGIIAGTGLLAGYSIMQAAYPGTGSPASGAATVTPTGTIGRQTTVQWVDLKDFDTSGAPKVKQSDKTVKIPYSDLASKVNSSTKYPKLKSALTKSTLIPLAVNLPVDSYVSYGGKSFRIVSVTPSGFQGCTNYLSGYWSGAGHSLTPTHSLYAISGPSSPSYLCPSYTYSQAASVRTIYSVVEAVPPVQIKSVPEGSHSLAASPYTGSPLAANTPVFSDFLGEIDDFIKDNPGSVSIIDGSHDGVTDSASPATLPAPVTQAAYDAAAAIGGASAAATQAASSAAGSLSTAQGNYNANPTPENAQKLADAQAEYDKLVAEQKRLDAEKVLGDLGDEEAKEKVGGSGFGGDDAYGDPDKDFDLGNRFKTFFDEMKTTAVFSLPNEFLTNIPDSSETSISFDGGRFGVQTFDFATFATLWSGLKAVILVAFGWFAIRIAVLKGGSS